MSITEIADVISGKIVNGEHFQGNIQSVSTDSRSISFNQMFIPIVGDHYDGHDFIDTAFKQGAILTLSSKEEKVGNRPAVVVEDTLKALYNLAAYQRSLFHKPVIAITGSVGKTSCKEMLYSILKMQFRVHKTKGNYNNHIGLPLTILETPEDAEVIILEMGMNHFGEIDLLSTIAKPDFGVITNIGVSHIENLGSRLGIFQAKTELLKHTNPRGLIVINGDDDLLITLADNKSITQTVTTFGFMEDFDYSVIEYDIKGFDGITALINSPLDLYQITIKALGKHMLYHALSGIAIAEVLNMEKEKIIAGIQEYIPEKMRLNLMKLQNGIIVINDAYNASVDSMKSSIDVLTKLETKGKKVAILGDMFEMGDHAKQGHEEVGEYVAMENIDLLICVGLSSKWMYETAIKKTGNRVLYFQTQESLMEQIPQLLTKQDVVLVKASRGMKLELTIEKIKEV